MSDAPVQSNGSSGRRAPSLEIPHIDRDRREPQPTYRITRQVFLRGLGFIYLCAFLSLWVQIDGLIGQRGILPAQQYFGVIRQASEQGVMIGDTPVHPYRDFPSLLWISQSDRMLHVLCAGGVVLSLLVMAGIAQAPAFALLWAFYLSLVVAGQDFLAFQWDMLLLESGFLAIFFAPLQMRPRLARQPEPSKVMRWLVWWLLFRLMFLSGLVKLTYGDAAWHDGTAMYYHYLSQPLPTWTSWYAYQLPNWMQRVSLWGMFIIEVGVPFLILFGRRARRAAFVPLVLLQLLIMATGNYGFFNLLTIVLCLTLLDDAVWKWCAKTGRSLTRRLRFRTTDAAPVPATSEEPSTTKALRFPIWITAPLAVLLVLLTTMAGITDSTREMRSFRWPAHLRRMQHWSRPFLSTNAYGLFRIMTHDRLELVIEGSRDGATWTEYEFKWKPGDVMRRPAYCMPHMPRLDWQIWTPFLGKEFGDFRWLVNFTQRLLEGEPKVLGLLDGNPFPDAPPRYLRVKVYDYQFAPPDQHARTGVWWHRTYRRLFAPPLMLGSNKELMQADR